MTSWRKDHQYGGDDQQTIERGITYLLKQAQLLCKYERGPIACYIYKEECKVGTIVEEQQCSMMKIPNILALSLTLPTFGGH
jgi:hypothetical protein